ncbi:MAG: hypothetical protein PWP08_1265 [Methanofollis sp.]|nr:hypothetical protein [Methanofollis sp.]
MKTAGGKSIAIGAPLQTDKSVAETVSLERALKIGRRLVGSAWCLRHTHQKGSGALKQRGTTIYSLTSVMASSYIQSRIRGHCSTIQSRSQAMQGISSSPAMKSAGSIACCRDVS